MAITIYQSYLHSHLFSANSRAAWKIHAAPSQCFSILLSISYLRFLFAIRTITPPADTTIAVTYSQMFVSSPVFGELTDVVLFGVSGVPGWFSSGSFSLVRSKVYSTSLSCQFTATFSPVSSHYFIATLCPRSDQTWI